MVPFVRKNYLTGRFDWGQRDELLEDDHGAGHAFPVAGYTIGYTRDVDLFRNVQTGVGTNFSVYGIDAALKPFYGDRPWGMNVFLRVRLKPAE